MSKGNSQISEEALMQDFCERIALRMKPIFQVLGAHNMNRESNRVFMHEWRPDYMSVVLNDPKKEPHKRYISRVVFDGLLYDPSSTKTDGESTINYGAEKPVPNGTKSIHNPYSDREFPVDLSHTDKLSRRHRTQLNLSSSFTSTTEVEGSYGGVSLKQTIALALGVNHENEKEDVREQEDTVVLPGVAIPPGMDVLQTVSKQSVTVETPFELQAYPDFRKIKLDFEDDAGVRNFEPVHKRALTLARTLHFNETWGKKHEIEVDGFLGLQRLLNGGDWRVRELKLFRQKATKQALRSFKWLTNKNNRYVELSGIERDTFDDNLRIHPKFVKAV